MVFNRKSAFNRSYFNRGDVANVYTVLTMVYSGDIAVGETVCIDSTYYTVLLDSANSLSKYSGNFPEVIPQPYNLIYSDTGSSRTVDITISWRDRKV
jgi:hypothetical protein